MKDLSFSFVALEERYRAYRARASCKSRNKLD